jgi:hypothetical protein
MNIGIDRLFLIPGLSFFHFFSGLAGAPGAGADDLDCHLSKQVKKPRPSP